MSSNLSSSHAGWMVRRPQRGGVWIVIALGLAVWAICS
jgi:hypothetical protein